MDENKIENKMHIDHNSQGLELCPTTSMSYTLNSHTVILKHSLYSLTYQCLNTCIKHYED